MCIYVYIGGIRGVRIVFLSFGLYQTGYTIGQLDYVKNPQAMEKNSLQGILNSVQADEILSSHHKYSKRANKIGGRIVASAQSYTKYNIKVLEMEQDKILNMLVDIETGVHPPETVPKTKKSSNSKQDNDHVATTLVSQLQDKDSLNNRLKEIEEKLQEWTEASDKVSGEWTYVITNSTQVNAFVTDILPRRIFINEGLFDVLNPTDDELGLVLGHEISHLICGHVSDTTKLQGFLYGIQLLLFGFVDPTGLLSIAFDYFISKIATYITAARSRDSEMEADNMGIIIAARACFDTKAGINVFHKLHGCCNDSKDLLQLANTSENTTPNEIGPNIPNNTSDQKDPSTVSWNDTHPTHESRIDILTDLHETVVPGHVSHCNEIMDKLHIIGIPDLIRIISNTHQTIGDHDVPIIK